jgi:hypothetical protein
MKKKIFVRGPVLSQSGYGEQARFALRALRSKEELFDIYIQPIAWGKTGWVWEESEFREWMDEKITKTQILVNEKRLQPDISLQITIPNEFEKLCPENIGYTAGIEADKVSPVWLQKGNDMSKILVVSSHAKETYMNTKAKAVVQHSQETIDYSLQTPVEVVWETTPRAEPEDIPGFTLDCDHNFLIVSQQGPRKNFLNAVTWWVEEFIDQEVGLIVKTNIASNSITDWQILEREFSKILAKYKDRKCKVYLLHGDLSAGQMTSLYTNSKIKAMINISHGEGFGLPLFEAAREAMPIITIGWSGQLDFLHHEGKNYFQEVEYTLQQIQKEAVWDGVLQADAKWAFANQGSYKMTLRKTLRNWSKCKETALELAALINDKFNEEKLFSGFCDAIYKEDPELLEWMQELEALDED